MNTLTSAPSTFDAMRAAGQWNDKREPMDDLDPEWTEQSMAMVSKPLNPGALDARTAEKAAT